MPHGDIAVRNQPLELLIIFGAATGAYIIANPKTVLFATGKHLARVLKGPPPHKMILRHPLKSLSLLLKVGFLLVLGLGAFLVLWWVLLTL